jgi:DNA polymerase-3 subunit gamma/tau
MCESCVELSRDGTGSLDVVEIDAASHNGVDDARDLRERAGFAPARDRFKIFILDEAHMVTQQGFNALLKIVEEPPEHVKFIFATTEPEKVIGTIRSRTHHYPFRLVPPATMLEYVGELCTHEKVTVEDGVLPLVIRAGGGSVRDTLSLLDQIIAGSDDNAVTRERTNNLLGYTPSELLDECIEAVGRGDSAGAFAAVDRVIQTGNDPRRFVEDVLERLRDLVIVDAVEADAPSVLRGVPADEIARMATLASIYGAAALSKAADIVNAALSGMTGTTPPRIHLELMVARLLTELPGEAQPARAAPAAPVVSAPKSPAAAPVAAPVVPATPPAPATPEPAVIPMAAALAVTPAAAEPVVAPTAAPAPMVPPVPAATGTLDEIVDSWDDILGELESNKGAWLVVKAARPTKLDADVLTLEFPEQMWVDRFKQDSGSGNAVYEELREVIVGALGVRLRFVPRVGLGVSAPTASDDTPTIKLPAPAEPAVAPPAPVERVEPPAPVEPVEPEEIAAPAAPQAKTQPEAERRGEAVVRELLGATLVSDISNSDAKSNGVDESDELLDLEPRAE